MKTNITLSIDMELRDKAKTENIVLSHFLNDKLKEHFRNDPKYAKEFKIELDKLTKNIGLANKKLTDWTDIYNEHKETIRNEKFDKIKDIIDLDDLTPEQLDDPQYMADLVKNIRADYGIRIDMTEIRELMKKDD